MVNTFLRKLKVSGPHTNFWVGVEVREGGREGASFHIGIPSKTLNFKMVRQREAHFTLTSKVQIQLFFCHIFFNSLIRSS